MLDFKGKTALVTGAAAGIGRATAITLAEHGAQVVLVDMNAQNLERTKKETEAYGAETLTYTCDVSDAARVNEVVADAKDKLGKIDILINNAGVFRDKSDFLSTPVDLWKKYFDINVMGMVHFIKVLLPDMLAAGYGRIVNVASVAGVYGNANMVHYSASKGAVIAMSKALAKEVADKGVLVNCVSPGSVSHSAVSDDIDGVEYTDFAGKATYLKRTGSHRENANVICFLASDAASYVTGQNLQVDGLRRQQ